MGLTVRQLVDNLTTYGILSASDVEALRETVAAQPDADAEPLLNELVEQNKLTKFQAMNLKAGKAKALVFGEYLILDKIGAGGMGQVYKGQHRRMKRIVALKVLPPQSVGSQKAVQRFYQEVEVSSKLTHPNIVTAYDSGEAHGLLYLVMEFVDGKNLSSHVTKHGPLSLEQTLNVILQAARGLAYAHGLGIIHRDVKPSNLLIGRDQTVKILDMGLARSSSPIGETGAPGSELTMSGEVMGTVDYMPPEQAADTRSADHRADIYALGCSLYRIYIGRAPYGGETAVQKILAHRDQPIPSLKAERPETPDAVERLFRKMVAKRVDDRMQTMTAVIQAIENVLAGVDSELSSVELGRDAIAEVDSFLPSGPSISPASVSVPPAAKPVGVAKPVAAASGGSQKLLLAGIGVTAIFVVAVAAFLLSRRGGEEALEPTRVALLPVAPKATAPAPRPPVATPPAPTATPQPIATAAPTTNMFQLPTTPAIGNDPPSTPSPPVPQPPRPDNPTPTPSPNATAAVPVVVPTKQEELTGEMDLLARIDPAVHTRRGKWNRVADAIDCPGNQNNESKFLDVPFIPPAEYDLTCVAIPTSPNVTFGPGLSVLGLPLRVHLYYNQFGLEVIDGQSALKAGNPTFREGNYYEPDQPVTIVCAVRKGRVIVTVNFRQVVDIDLTADRIGTEDGDYVTPGKLFLSGNRGVRFTALKIGPPQMSLAPPTAGVNLAAAFSQANVAEGTATGRRGEVLLSSASGSYAKVQFKFPRAESYVLRAVVERGTGGGTAAISLPLTQQRRTSAVVDYFDQRMIGLHFVGPGPVDVNPTGRRPGLLLTPGELHVIEVKAEPSGSEVHFEVRVDGREWVNYSSSAMGWDGSVDVPDTTAVGFSHQSGNLRIVRFDQLPADGRRLPVPDAKAREAALPVVRGLIGDAEAKTAPLDAKLSAVDLLRKKAATELENVALRYEALDAASRIAAAAGDLSGAYEAGEDLTTTFDVGTAEYRTRILEAFKYPRPTPQAKQQFAEEAIKLTARAARCEQFQLALEMNAAVEKMLAAAPADLKRELRARAVEYEFAVALQPAALEAREKLKGKTNDPAARSALGLYLGCALNDWPGAANQWSRADDPTQQTLSALELGDLSSGDAKFGLAEKWLELSDKEKTPGAKWCYLERAAYWYRRSAINVSDVKRPILARQLAKIAQLRKTSNGAGGPRRPLDAVKIGDRWYQYYSIPMYADAAQAMCENLGGNLLMLDNAAESQAVAQFVLQRLSTLGAERATIWLGANDVDKEGTFRRLDGVPLAPPAYVNWVDGEPNNGNGDEDHVSWDISYSSGEIFTSWRDGNRSWVQMTTVCEWDH